MSAKNQRFIRLLAERRYKKLFVVAVEGEKTEPQYFALFNEDSSVVFVRCLRAKHSSPKQILKELKAFLRKESLRKTDEAWVVIDKDSWTEEQLDELFAWSKSAENFGMALSNPKFELWLLLHLEEVRENLTAEECQRRLKRHLPNYEKEVDPRKFTRQKILEAVERAKRRDMPRCDKWPLNSGSTVYRLVEGILAASDQDGKERQDIAQAKKILKSYAKVKVS